jgi:hypothetical protein
LLVGRLWGLRRVCSRIWVVHEISSRCKTCGVWLLLGILCVCLLSALTLRWKNWVRKGRGGGRIVSCILGKLFSIAQIEIEPIAVVILHIRPNYVLIDRLRVWNRNRVEIIGTCSPQVQNWLLFPSCALAIGGGKIDCLLQVDLAKKVWDVLRLLQSRTHKQTSIQRFSLVVFCIYEVVNGERG